MRGSVRPLMACKVSDGSAHLKNIETSSSGGGTVGDGGVLFRMVEITEDG